MRARRARSSEFLRLAVHRLGILLVAALVLLSAAGAHAANIALLKPSGSSPALAEAMNRLKGELFALGLEVEIVARPANREAEAVDPRAWLEQTANERGIDAVIDVIGETTPTAVDIWIFERSPRRTRVSRVVLEPDAPNAAETLAIRAIEVLRSNFVEIDLAARARTDDVPITEPPRDAPVKPPPSRLVERVGLQAGAGVLTSLDGVGPAILPLVRADWAVSSWLVAQATFAGLGTRPTLETDAGSATVAQGYGVLGLCYCLPSDPGIRPFVSLSAGALRTSLEGRAQAPEEGHSVDQWSFLVDGSVGARLRFFERYYFTPAFHVQFAQPYVAVHFVNELVASSGRPNLMGSLTVGAWL
jgi:hypothetical protein